MGYFGRYSTVQNAYLNRINFTRKPDLRRINGSTMARNELQGYVHGIG